MVTPKTLKMKVEIHNDHLMAEAKVVMKASVILRPVIYSQELTKSLELAVKESLSCHQVAVPGYGFIIRLLLHSQGV